MLIVLTFFPDYNLTTNFTMCVFNVYSWQLDDRINNIIMDYRINNPWGKKDLCKRL